MGDSQVARFENPVPPAVKAPTLHQGLHALAETTADEKAHNERYSSLPVSIDNSKHTKRSNSGLLLAET